MVNINIQAKDILGILPALNPKVIEKPFVLEGQNFYSDAEGLFSAYPSRLTSPVRFTEPSHIDAFDVGTQTFIFTASAVFVCDISSLEFVPQFTYSTGGVIAPWSHALVGAKHYFSHGGLNGVIQFDPITAIWQIITSITNVDYPAGAKFVTQSQGRLIVLGSGSYAWSVLDDGENLTTSTTTGAGAQSTAIVGGITYRVEETKDGFLTYTSKGVIRASLIGGGVVGTFRHVVLTRQIKLLNAFCLANIDQETHITLSKLGIKQTTGSGFTDFEPLFNEFLIHNFIPLFLDTRLDAFKLHWDDEADALYMSVSDVLDSALYNKAFVLHKNLAKWSEFNHLHYNFMRLSINSGVLTGNVFGYIGNDNYFHRIAKGEVVVEIDPTKVGAYLYSPEVQFPAYFDAPNNQWIMPSVLDFKSVDEQFFNVNHLSWWYTSPETIPSIEIPNTQPLASFIKVGLFRYIEQEYPDEVGQVSNISISAGTKTPQQIEEDWNLLQGEEDWNILTGEEDWGDNIVASTVFSAKIIATNDGITTYLENVLDAQEVYNDGELAFYTTDVNGIFHIIELSALVAGQSFHLKLLELSGTIAGRL